MDDKMIKLARALKEAKAKYAAVTAEKERLYREANKAWDAYDKAERAFRGETRRFVDRA